MGSGVAGVRDSRATTTHSQRRRRRLTREARDVFLEGLAAGWTVTHAAERAGFNKRRFYEARDDDRAFAARMSSSCRDGRKELTAFRE